MVDVQAARHAAITATPAARLEDIAPRDAPFDAAQKFSAVDVPEMGNIGVLGADQKKHGCQTLPSTANCRPVMSSRMLIIRMVCRPWLSACHADYGASAGASGCDSPFLASSISNSPE
jgi:hypothetical protein